MIRALRIPARLVVTALTLDACSNSPQPAPDAQADGTADVGGDARVDSATDVAMECYVNPFTMEMGYRCTRTSRTPSGVICPEAACTRAQCPAGCVSCESLNFCIPDGRLPDGGTPMCERASVCAGEPDSECGPSCRSVG